ncbi:hypothetical protein Tco_0696898 [Tanacetum coccineum]
MQNANPSSTLGYLSQQPPATTHTELIARVNKLLKIRQTIDSFLSKTINELTNQSSDFDTFCPRDGVKELEIRTKQRNNFEEELFKDMFPTEEELAYHKELLGRKAHLLEDKQILSVGILLMLLLVDEYARQALENKLLSVSLSTCLVYLFFVHLFVIFFDYSILHYGERESIINLRISSQQPPATTRTELIARVNKLLKMRQTIDSLFSKTINELTNQSFDSEMFCPRDRIKELELRMKRRNNFEEELFKDMFLTEEELAYHKELLGEPCPPFLTLEPKIKRGDP